ncbi:MAG: hypothetical protein ACREU7_14030 [Burkholderiales bacterium]
MSDELHRLLQAVIALDPSNIGRAFEMLAKLGYKPAVPIAAEQFADSAVREQWVRDNGMKVLNFFSDRHRETSVDVFVTEPFDFERESNGGDAGRTGPRFERPVCFPADPDRHERGCQPAARYRRRAASQVDSGGEKAR